MQNSIRTSEFSFLILVVIVLILSGFNLTIGDFSIGFNIEDKYLDAMMGLAGGWAVLRQNAKAKNGHQ